VVAHALGVPVLRANLDPDCSDEGEVLFSRASAVTAETDCADREAAERYVVTLYAGEAAERRHLLATLGPRFNGTEPSVAARHDARLACSICQALAPPGSSWELEGDLCERARTMVAAEWDAVCRVAAALLERQTLSGDEALSIIEAGTRSPP
jgi:hypothetical protein